MTRTDASRDSTRHLASNDVIAARGKLLARQRCRMKPTSKHGGVGASAVLSAVYRHEKRRRLGRADVTETQTGTGACKRMYLSEKNEITNNCLVQVHRHLKSLALY